jgi:polysaccharide biosynthesis transport protein
VTVVAAAIYLHREQPVYQATASVQLSASDAPSSTSGSTPSSGINSSPALVTSQQLTKLLPKNPLVTSDVAASFDSSTGILALTGKSSLPSGAQATANAYAEAYVAYLKQEVQAQINVLNLQLTKVQASITQLAKEKKKNPPGTSPALIEALSTAAIQNYTTIQGQLTAIETSPAPAQMAQSAGPGVAKASSKTKVLGLAVLVGLIAAAGIALIREQLDTRLRDPLDIEGMADSPLLAELPYDRESARRPNELAVVEGARSSFSESIRELRTAIQVLLDTANCPVLVITSPEPSDGKTLVTANLAASWALSGKRVIVVSGDLRRPRIEQLLGTPPGADGVATILQSSLREGGDSGASSRSPSRGTDGRRTVYWDVKPDAADAGEPLSADTLPSRRQVARSLHGTEIVDLAILPAGPSPADPADLLATLEMAVLITRLREMADVVLIDSPPVLAVADAAILGTYAEGVVLVATAGKTTAEILERTVRRLAGAQANLLGVALNKSQRAAGQAYPQYYATARAGASAPAQSTKRRSFPRRHHRSEG